MNEERLDGKVVLVTGGTQGLGREIALRCAQLGAAGVAICGRNARNGADVSAELEALGCQALYVQADLGRVEHCERVISAVDACYGRLHGLVNAAASTARGTVLDTTAEDWDAMMALNLRAPFLLLQGAARIMRREGEGGSVVNILSVSAYGGQPKLTAYCTSKGALAVFTKNAAYSLRPDRIRVNGLNIGWMVTPAEHAIQAAEGAPDNWVELADARSDFGRILRPLDVARMACFLLADTGAMVTGSIVDFDHNVIMGAFD